MSHRRQAVLMVVGLLWAAAPVFAHHAIQAQFDFDKAIQVTGVLTKVEWINPHAYFTLEVKDANGQVTVWEFETFGPAGLRKAGFSKATFFKAGETYTVDALATKDGSHGGWIKDLRFPDGKIVTIWYGDPNAR
jgi:hypothetical protein